MRFPKLSPLQARFAASFGATLFLVLVYFAVFGPRLAYAIELESTVQGSQSEAFPRDSAFSANLNERGDGAAAVDPMLVLRAPEGLDQLENNVAKLNNLDIGETQNWVFPKEALAKRSENGTLFRRATTVYVTATTCLQPFLNSTQVSTDAGPPQLHMYISQSEEFTRPGPGIDSPDVVDREFDGGYIRFDLDVEGDLFIGIGASNNTRYSGIYNYELAVSVDSPFHVIEPSTPYLFFVDSDSRAALLQTNDTTQAMPEDEEYKEWMAKDPLPYTMFAHRINDSDILGLHHSYCGLNKNARIKKESNNFESSMTNRGVHQKPKQQFYVKELNQSSSYYGFLAVEGRGQGVGGGGKVWRPMNFTTKEGNNCAVLHNLEFCSEIAYAVPSNPTLDRAELTGIYDRHAENLYKNFTYSLQQIACNTGDSSQYSLARNCTQCAAAYKRWLCAVTIPRCQDFSSSLPFLRARSVGHAFTNGSFLPDTYPGRQEVMYNSSRNPIIDTDIKPGPYKEVLPCQDLCHELVQSCPASLGFGCPVEEWLNASYGVRSPNGDITCSYLGAAYFLNGVQRKIGDANVLGFALICLTLFWSLVWGVDA